MDLDNNFIIITRCIEAANSEVKQVISRFIPKKTPDPHLANLI
jgi:hypothetical protein